MALAPRTEPPLNAAFFEGNEQISLPWMRYFQRLADQVTALEAQNAALVARLAAAGIP